jgi:hypothetical protein
VQSPLEDMCGIEVTETPNNVTLTLTGNISNLASRYLTSEELSTPEKTPCSEKIEKLVDSATDPKPKGTCDASVKQEYQEVVGSLLYIAMTVRPDIGYAVGMLSRAMNNPSQELLDEAHRTLRYLYYTRELGLRYSRAKSIDLYGESDSDWAVKASTSAYIFYLAGAAISYCPRNGPPSPCRPTEAEIYAASLAGLEAVFLRSLLDDLKPGAVVDETLIGVDNKGAVDMSEDYVANSRNRHFSRRHLKIRELVEDEVVRLRSIKTDDNTSDILTKFLYKNRFEALRKKLLNM